MSNPRTYLALMLVTAATIALAAFLLTPSAAIDTKFWIVVVSGSAVGAVAIVMFLGVIFGSPKIERTQPEIPPLPMLDRTHRIATRDDLDTIAHLLNRRPMEVLVRDLYYGNYFPLLQVCRGPFGIEVRGDERAVIGFDLAGAIAKLRIVEHDAVEIIDGTRPTWTPASMGGIRIYIPK